MQFFLKSSEKWIELASNILAIVDAPVDSAEGSPGYDTLDDEVRRVNFPLLPLLLEGSGTSTPRHTFELSGSGKGARVSRMVRTSIILFFLLHQNLAEVPLELLIDALQINLICSHKPIISFLHLSLLLLLVVVFHSPPTKLKA